MGKHAANKTLVVEAQLFGAYQRRIDIASRASEVELDKDRARVAELERELEAMGGSPGDILAAVQLRGVNVGKPGGRLE